MKRIIPALALLLILPLLGFAQAKPASAPQKLTLEFVDGADLTVISADKSQLKFNVGIFEGDPIPSGATIVTGKDTSAEFKLAPNGSIVKLGRASTFIVTSLGTQATDKNAFQVAAGKIKAVAAKGSNITVTTPTAVCGVRGTDFVVEVSEGKEFLGVKHGLVDFAKVDKDGKESRRIHVSTGNSADARSDRFEPESYPASRYDEDNADMGFQKLVEAEVDQPSDEDVAAEIEKAKQEDAAVGQPTSQVETKPISAADAAGTVAGGLGKMDKQEVQSGLMKWLQDVMGFELGSVSINGTTYSKAIVQPNFDLGKLKIGLYLPIIYQSDLFNPADWYHPAGNDEWSFGFQKQGGKTLWERDWVSAALDTAADVALKFKYIEFGKQLDDPFFIKLGNLDSLTIGHGLIMRNYDNSTEFPAIRRIGVNTGFDFGGVGFEALVNDLADPWLFGGRFFIRPVSGSKIALGLSGAVDSNPASELYTKNADGTVNKTAAQAATGDPLFISTGLDVDLPIIQGGDFLTLRAFADAAVTVPLVTKAFTVAGGQPVAAGLQYQLFIDPSFNIQNWGAAAGLMGNLLFLDYRLEYRYFTGIFKPSFYDSTYDKSRTWYAIQYANYLSKPSSFPAKPTVMGIYGEGGFGFFKGAQGDYKLNFRFGYGWPWSPTASTVGDQLARSSDELHVSLVVKKGLIPLIDVSGAVYYDRRGLAQSLFAAAQPGGTAFQLVDMNTTFSGELVVPVPKTPNLDIAVVFTQVPVRNPVTGDVEYVNPDLGIPKLTPSITLETRFHF